jgi:hypothetical protein
MEESRILESRGKKNIEKKGVQKWRGLAGIWRFVDFIYSFFKICVTQAKCFGYAAVLLLSTTLRCFSVSRQLVNLD